MVLIPAGEFLMGSEASGEGPPHRLSLDAFYIDRYEVTNAQYQRFVDAAGHRTPQHEVDARYDLWAGGTFPPEFKSQPVVNVDWHDAAAYCEWAGKRLPTEAEWEKAARGTDGRLYPWGNDPPTPARLNFARRWEGPQTLRPVGSFESGRSPYGAYDMAGNVWEWVGDWYGAGYYQAAPARNPRGPGGGSAKVLRGGSWTNLAGLVRATHRYGADPEMRNSDTGFRCARDLAR
jgi:formylglycine-generating enzyme required for sulfatase activity